MTRRRPTPSSTRPAPSWPVAERGIAKPDLSADDVAELEAAHQEVLDAERKASGRFNRSKRSLDEAMAREQAILDRVGFPTWSAYVMGSGLLAIDPAAEERLEKAKLRLRGGRGQLGRRSARPSRPTPSTSALLDQLEAVYLEAFDLLGRAGARRSRGGAARATRKPSARSPPRSSSTRLAYQLEVVGLDLGERPSLDRTVVVAEAFLAEASGINERVEELEAERHHVSGALEEAEEELADPAAGAARRSTSRRRRLAPVEVAITAEDIAALESRAGGGRPRPSSRRPSGSRRARRLSTRPPRCTPWPRSRLMQDGRASWPSRARRTAAPVAPVRAFEVPVDEVEGDAGQEALEFYLLARLAGLRNVSFAGAVPLVVDDAFDGMASRRAADAAGQARADGRGRADHLPHATTRPSPTGPPRWVSSGPPWSTPPSPVHLTRSEAQAQAQ